MRVFTTLLEAFPTLTPHRVHVSKRHKRLWNESRLFHPSLPPMRTTRIWCKQSRLRLKAGPGMRTQMFTTPQLAQSMGQQLKQAHRRKRGRQKKKEESRYHPRRTNHH